MMSDTDMTPRELSRWVKDHLDELARREIMIKPEDRDDVQAVLNRLNELMDGAQGKQPEEKQAVVNEAFPHLLSLLRAGDLVPGGLPRLRGLGRHDPSEFASPEEVEEIWGTIQNMFVFALRSCSSAEPPAQTPSPAQSERLE
ncbi:MAG TPA: hypothetical protein VJY33_24095 [Isosphaeraceae bacterium]|nr:hypothetical protein [Isosphaeraceae bacterium]